MTAEELAQELNTHDPAGWHPIDSLPHFPASDLTYGLEKYRGYFGAEKYTTHATDGRRFATTFCYERLGPVFLLWEGPIGGLKHAGSVRSLILRSVTIPAKAVAAFKLLGSLRDHVHDSAELPQGDPKRAEAVEAMRAAAAELHARVDDLVALALVEN